MRPILFIAVVSACAALFSGCNTSPRGSFNMAPRTVTIITEPDGASVTQIHPLDQPSTDLGTTPLNERSVPVITDITTMKKMPYSEAQRLMTHVGNVVVRIEKPGYESYRGTLKTEAGRTAIHTITLRPKP